jgi:hypothetical protein
MALLIPPSAMETRSTIRRTRFIVVVEKVSKMKIYTTTIAYWCSKDKILSNYEVKLYLERVLIINGDNVKRVLNEC